MLGENWALLVPKIVYSKIVYNQVQFWSSAAEKNANMALGYLKAA